MLLSERLPPKQNIIRLAGAKADATLLVIGLGVEGGGTHIDFHFGARTRPPQQALTQNPAFRQDLV